MSEVKEMRLAKAATQYNVSLEHIIDELKKGGHAVENKPTTKLTVDQVLVLEKAFNKDRAIRQEVENSIVEKTRKEATEVKPEVITVSSRKREEEKEVLIKTNAPMAEPVAKTTKKKAEVKPEEEVVSLRGTVKVDGPKVVDVVDLTPKSKKTTKKVVEEETKPVEAVEATEAVEVQPEVVQPEVVAPPVEEKVVKKPEPEAEVKHETKRVVLEGTKVLGSIQLKEDKPVKKESEADAKKKRARIQKPERTRVTQDQFTERKAENFRRNQGGPPARPQTPEVREVSEKEIEERMKQTMARIASMTSKSDRSKLRKEKREAIQEKLAAQQEVNQGSKLQVTEFITVSELASLMNVPPTKIIQSCFQMGVMVSINQRLDADVIELVAGEFGYEVSFISAADQTAFNEIQDDEASLKERAPIVTIMGHVDHGKTSLLDYIRKANVVSGEAGGITQHIGAYDVMTANGKRITFLDTPGHEAFTAMRARGAKVTDIAVIVVAADDAVMPQTREAINHAQSAGVPMIFAINKVDKDGANPERIREQLAQMNLLVEEWGGKYQSQEISAKKGMNIDKLLEKILLEAELLNLRANPDRVATGSVVEASLDKGRGYTTTLLVDGGTLHPGDFIVSGQHFGKVKLMTNHKGEKLDFAGPAVPVQILGLNGAPQAGERFMVFADEQEGKNIAAKRNQLEREQGIRTKKHITLDEIGRRLALGNFKELNVIIKGDVDGSVEALADSLMKLSTSEIQVKVVHKGVGQISESDVLLATASDAIVIGFNVRPSANAKKIAETENIEIRMYSIIYNAINEIKSAMEGLLEPTVEEKILGAVEVRETFHVSKVGTIAGCFVKEGRILRNAKIRIIRDGIVIHTGLLGSLKRFKDDAKEVTAGLDCGVQIKDYQDIQVGDIVEPFEEISVKRTLE